MVPVLVPTLDEIAAHPERASEIPPATAARMLELVAGVLPLLLLRSRASTENGTPDPAATEKLLKIEEAAALLSIPRAFCYELARRGEIPTVKVGRKYIRVPLHALQKVLDRGLSFAYKTHQRRTPHAYER